MTLRFADLNPLGRAIIVVVAVLTAGVAAVAFATSYGALYAFISDTGLYSDTGRYANRLNQAWPLLLDATFIVAQLAALLAKILRGSRGWPILTMLVTGALTVWFNIQHAGADPGRRLAAVLPPILMMLAFEIDVSIVKWVMRALGKPLETASPLPAGALAGPIPGMVWRPDAAPYGAGAGGPYGAFPPHPVYAGTPSVTQQGTGQTGHGELPESTKRTAVEMYLSRLDLEQLAVTTGSSITVALAGQGVPVEESYAGRILGEWRTSRPSANGTRSRGKR